MQELLTKWSELKTKSEEGPSTIGSVQQRISDELAILEPLLAAGCSQIPGEPFDVRFLIRDRQRLRREINAKMEDLS